MVNAVCFLLDKNKLRCFRINNLPDWTLKSKIMEVKIKNGEEMIDATIEMVDGVMVVSPKEVKFEPKDGDVLSSDFKGKCQGTFVFEEASECGEAIFHVALKADGRFFKGDGCSYFGYIDDARPATEEERKKLFDKLKEEGYEWDAEKKKVVKIKWKPKFDAIYYKPQLNRSKFRVNSVRWFNLKEDEELYQKGWVFQTNEDCAVFVDKLNQAIEGVKP